MISRLVLAAALSLAGLSALAGPVLYVCDMTDKHHNLGWVGDKIAILVNDDGSVTVMDEPILIFNDNKPMQAKVTKKTSDKLKLRWSIPNARDSNNLPFSLNYSSTLKLKSRNIVVYAQPVGFSKRWSGRGTCKIHTGTNALETFRLR